MTSDNAPPDDLAAVQRCHESYARIRSELSKVIVGQVCVIEQVFIALLSRSHALMEGVPGLAKTLLASSLAAAAELRFKRIQLTPDMIPSDLTGTQVIQEDLETGERKYKFLAGPVFANVILADQLNRAPPKTQAALLEAMRERQVSAGGTAYWLPDPFFVLATQDPLEKEGTHPLPAAQLDHFLLYIKVYYPSGAEEWEIARRVTTGQQRRISPLMSGEDILGFQQLVARMPVSDRVLGYAWALVRASRPGKKESADFVDRWVEWGAGPRGLLSLVTCAKARAILHGRRQATVGDVRAMAKPALRHRIAGNYAAVANAMTSDGLVEMLMEAVPADQQYQKPAEVKPEALDQ